MPPPSTTPWSVCKRCPSQFRLIRELHARLLKGVRGEESRPGELRTVQNWVGPAGAGPVEAAFVPPPADEVPEALGQLERFLHDDQPMPLLIRIGLAHAQFETIHPFLDGNGRVGRLLIVFLLCERAVLHKPALYISHYLRAHRQRYFDLLQAVRTQGDWEGWAQVLRGGGDRVNRAGGRNGPERCRAQGA